MELGATAVDSGSDALVPKEAAAAAASSSDAGQDGAAPQSQESLAACLAKYYLAKPEGTGLRTEAGALVTLQITDPTGKSYGLLNVFEQAYSRGAIQPVLQKGWDPGRVRINALFEATYGAEPLEVESKLRWVNFVGHRLRIAHRAAPSLERVSKRLTEISKTDPSILAYLDHFGGTYNFRNIAGTDQLSAHSFGIAIDISTYHSDYWRNDPDLKNPKWKNRIPQVIVDAFEAESFIWGGRWYHYDTMHFEYRPELLDPACVAAWRVAKAAVEKAKQ
jgi:hypothetical protein